MNMQQSAALLRAYVDANIPAMLTGKPGVGKSDIVRQLAAALNCGLLDVRASLLDPVDVRGIPSVENGVTRWNPPTFLPIVERDGETGILFLDELTNAPISTQAALYQLVLDRQIGEYKLPPGWRIVAAGNSQSDRAAANRMSSALANRFAHIEAESDAPSFCAHARRSGFHPAIPDFIDWTAHKGDSLLHVMPKDDSKAFPTPRAWERVSDFIKSAPADLWHMGVAGIVGATAGAAFMGFVEVWRTMPKLADVFANPKSAPVPLESSGRYAVACAVARMMTAANVGAGIVYLERCGAEFATMALLDAFRRDPALLETAAAVDWKIRNQHVHM